MTTQTKQYSINSMRSTKHKSILNINMTINALSVIPFCCLLVHQHYRRQKLPHSLHFRQHLQCSWSPCAAACMLLSLLFCAAAGLLLSLLFCAAAGLLLSAFLCGCMYVTVSAFLCGYRAVTVSAFLCRLSLLFCAGCRAVTVCFSVRLQGCYCLCFSAAFAMFGLLEFNVSLSQ